MNKYFTIGEYIFLVIGLVLGMWMFSLLAKVQVSP